MVYPNPIFSNINIDVTMEDAPKLVMEEVHPIPIDIDLDVKYTTEARHQLWMFSDYNII